VRRFLVVIDRLSSSVASSGDRWTVSVCVPHDQSPGPACVDQGPLFD